MIKGQHIVSIAGGTLAMFGHSVETLADLVNEAVRLILLKGEEFDTVEIDVSSKNGERIGKFAVQFSEKLGVDIYIIDEEECIIS